MKKIILSIFSAFVLFFGLVNADYELVSKINFDLCNNYSSITYNKPITSPGQYKLVIDDNVGRLISYVTFKCPNDSNKFRINGSNNFIFNYDGSSACDLAITNSTFNGTQCPVVSLYKNIPAFDFGGDSALTPAISGLQDTTFQIIPLVLFIGIGLLLVTLGFFAIRWLLSWLYSKINSIFRSKRS